MCASCQCYVKSDTQLPEKSDERRKAMLSEVKAYNVKSRKNCFFRKTN